MPKKSLTPAKTVRRRVLGIVFIGLTVAANIAVAQFGKTLNSWVSMDHVDVGQADYDARIASDRRLATQEQAEGTVLVKNDNQTLPFSKNTDKVNVFGWSSTQWVASGSGSGGVAGNSVGILDALVNYGVSYNTELSDMYQRYSESRPRSSQGSLNSFADDYCRLVEPSIQNRAWYTQKILDDAQNYSDAALVVISRVGGESIDAPGTQSKLSNTGTVTRDPNRNYLELSTQELDLLTYVGTHFDKVVVLVNSTNPMELGPLNTIPGIDACLLVGTTGTTGANAIPQLLWGDASPSGRTADTYPYDFKTDPSYVNSGSWGHGTYTNGQGYYPADGTLNGNVGTIAHYDGVSYYDYQEGIYVGYRWYETADAEGYWDDVSNEYGTGYQGVVQYPFGYGLSYTTFDWRVIDRYPQTGNWIDENTQISYTVRVTNTGSVPGKEVVELYFSPPYKPGEIQKPAWVLGTFAKTDMLAPGQSQDVTLTVTGRDMASYDCYDANHDGFSGYELDGGAYTVQLRHDAHTPADIEDGSLTLNIPRTIELDTDPATGATVTNRFTGSGAVDGVSIDGSNSDGNITWLDRADFAGTFPHERADNRAMTENIQALNLYSRQQAEATIDPTGPSVKTGQSGNQMLGDDGSITNLGYALGMNYNDPQWDGLLNQMTTQEQEDLVLHGYSNTTDIRSIGKPQSKEVDGPSQVGSFNQPRHGVGFADDALLAQTWNTDLAHQIGQALGQEAADLGVDGIYAPSANIHRSPFGGRNYEYFSEDPLLTGDLCVQEVQGIKETGTYCFVKHMILNDQDTNRDGMYTWLTEQALREIYLKPFQLLVEEGGATGMMSSYNRIGAVWAGGSPALLRDVLRDEWGFRGSVITDYADHHTYMNPDQMLRAGGDLYMDGIMRNGAFFYGTTSNTFQNDLRGATKDILYTWLNARSENLLYNQANPEQQLVRPIKHTGLPIFGIVIGTLDAFILTIGTVKIWQHYRKTHPAHSNAKQAKHAR